MGTTEGKEPAPKPVPSAVEDRSALQRNPRLIDALVDIGVIGEWSFDYRTKIFRSSPLISRAFAVDVERGEVGEPVEVYERAVHPADVAWLRQTRAAPPGWSGLRVTEMRVTGTDGIQRWIMVRGRFVLDENDQPLIGYGIMLDLTSYHDSGDQPMITPAAPFVDPLIVLSDALATSFRAARQFTNETIAIGCQRLLFATGRLLALRLQRGDPVDGPRTLRPGRRRSRRSLH